MSSFQVEFSGSIKCGLSLAIVINSTQGFVSLCLIHRVLLKAPVLAVLAVFLANVTLFIREPV